MQKALKQIPKSERKKVSAKIRKLIHEGIPQKQAVATALNMARRKKLGVKGGYKRNPHFKNDSYIITSWFERDRAHVALENKTTGETVVEWWDRAAEDAVIDGFLRPNDLLNSAIEYAKSHKMIWDEDRPEKNPSNVSRHYQILEVSRSFGSLNKPILVGMDLISIGFPDKDSAKSFEKKVKPLYGIDDAKYDFINGVHVVTVFIKTKKNPRKLDPDMDKIIEALSWLYFHPHSTENIDEEILNALEKEKMWDYEKGVSSAGRKLLFNVDALE